MVGNLQLKNSMKLYIDTSSNSRTRIMIDGQQVECDSNVWHSQTVLPMIIEQLNKISKSVLDITEIEYNIGPGSYTGLRVGAVIANVLGYSLKVPVNGKMIDASHLELPKYES